MSTMGYFPKAPQTRPPGSYLLPLGPIRPEGTQQTGKLLESLFKPAVSLSTPSLMLPTKNFDAMAARGATLAKAPFVFPKNLTHLQCTHSL